MKQPRNKKTGQYKRNRHVGARWPLFVLAVVTAVAVGAVYVQEGVEAWTLDQMELQDYRHEQREQATTIEVVPVYDTNDRTISEVSLWYVDKVNELLNADTNDGLESVETILDDMNQYARDCMYLEMLVTTE